jgi:hypothetical protein
MASENDYLDVVEFIDEQIEKLYEDESYLNTGGNEEYTPDGERAKWTYFQEFTTSEQEIMEKDVNTLFDDMYAMTERGVQSLVSELAVVFEDAPPSEDNDTGNDSNSVSSTNTAKDLEQKKGAAHAPDATSEEEAVPQAAIIVCRESEEAEEVSTPHSKCEALLKDIRDLRTSVMTEIGTLLDTKFTLYRQSLGINRTKNHTKLMEARTAMMLFKKKFEYESTANMNDRDRLVYSAMEQKYKDTISNLENDVGQYIASVNLKTQRNLGLNEELNEYKTANAHLTGKCERIFEDLTNVSTCIHRYIIL